jgi:hypothetical protein
VILFCTALEDCVAVEAVYVVAETKGLVKDHGTGRYPLRTVFAALMVGAWSIGCDGIYSGGSGRNIGLGDEQSVVAVRGFR